MLKRPFLTKRVKKHNNNVSCADENNFIEIEEVEIEEKQQQSAENVPSCKYCAATIVARPLRTTVKGKKPALRVIVNSNLRSLIHWIQESGRVSGRITFIDSYELLASCHVLT